MSALISAASRWTSCGLYSPQANLDCRYDAVLLAVGRDDSDALADDAASIVGGGHRELWQQAVQIQKMIPRNE